MSVTSGFFDSLNGDRKYNAEQLSSIFNGIITDGVFQSIGTALEVKASGDNKVTVGIGRCWFNSTWLNNDAILPVTLPNPEILLDRIDAVVIEIDRSLSVRTGSIKAIAGVGSSSPVRPTLANDEYVHQYPLAYIMRPAGTDVVSQSNITNMIGTTSCPYITAILKSQTIDKIVAQWESEFNDWFDNLKDLLSDDVATNLAGRIATIDSKLVTVKTVTFAASSWTGSSQLYTCSVDVSGVTADTQLLDIGIAYPTSCTKDTKKKIDKAAGYIYDIETAAGKIIAYAYAQPAADITLGYKEV